MRLNPDLEVDTHEKIATGSATTKFGLAFADGGALLPNTRPSLARPAGHFLATGPPDVAGNIALRVIAAASAREASPKPNVHQLDRKSAEALRNGLLKTTSGA